MPEPSDDVMADILSRGRGKTKDDLDGATDAPKVEVSSPDPGAPPVAATPAPAAPPAPVPAPPAAPPAPAFDPSTWQSLDKVSLDAVPAEFRPMAQRLIELGNARNGEIDAATAALTGKMEEFSQLIQAMSDAGVSDAGPLSERVQALTTERDQVQQAYTQMVWDTFAERAKFGDLPDATKQVFAAAWENTATSWNGKSIVEQMEDALRYACYRTGVPYPGGAPSSPSPAVPGTPPPVLPPAPAPVVTPAPAPAAPPAQPAATPTAIRQAALSNGSAATATPRRPAADKSEQEITRQHEHLLGDMPDL